MKLLTVIPISPDTAPTAELLCDWIYQLNGCVQSGHCLIVASGSVHGELVKKVSIAADVAFESHAITSASESSRNPRNDSFAAAAKLIQSSFRFPWLWLEPDCVPIRAGWLDTLAEAYNLQPKRYLGLHLKYNDTVFMARCGVYPVGAHSDLRESLSGETPFELSAAGDMIVRSSKTKLIQHGVFETVEDVSKIRSDAVVVSGDKTGAILQWASETVKPAGRKVAIKARI